MADMQDRSNPAAEALSKAEEAMQAAVKAMDLARDAMRAGNRATSMNSTTQAPMHADTTYANAPLTASQGNLRVDPSHKLEKYPTYSSPATAVDTPHSHTRSESFTHVDLLDAVWKLSPNPEQSRIYQRLASGMKKHGEDVADRNIDGLEPFTFTDSSPSSEQRSDSEDLTPIASNGTHASHYIANSFSRWHEVLFVATISAAQLLTQAGLAQGIAALHIIGASFGISSPAQLSWYPAAYSLTVGTFILPAGRLGDVYGHKLIFIIGWLWYAVWSLLCGLSIYVQRAGLDGNVFFCVCRAFQGIGPALCLPNALAILGRSYQAGKRKNMMFALFGATAPSGFVVSAAFSGLFAQKVGWQWGYYVMAMVCVGMATLTVLVIPSSSHEFRRTPSQGTLSFKRRWSQLDGNGMLFGVTGLVLVNFAWNQGPVVGWTTPYTYFILIIGLMILSAFFVIEAKASNPLVPLDAITRDTLFVLGCIAFGWASFGIWMFYSWQILEVERGVTPLLGAAMFSPVCISGLLAAILTGLALHKLGPQLTMLISMFAFCIGSIIMATAPVSQIYWAQTFVSIIIMPWGMDMSFPSATIIMSDSVKREHQGIAASLVNTVVNYSISIGLGIAGTVETQTNNGGANTLKGYRSAYYVGIGLAGSGVILGSMFVLLNHLDIRKKTAQTEKTEYRERSDEKEQTA
jgi:MFS family permease